MHFGADGRGSKGLSGGAIAGIVIGTVVGAALFALLVGLICCCCRRKQARPILRCVDFISLTPDTCRQFPSRKFPSVRSRTSHSNRQKICKLLEFDQNGYRTGKHPMMEMMVCFSHTNSGVSYIGMNAVKHFLVHSRSLKWTAGNQRNAASLESAGHAQPWAALDSVVTKMRRQPRTFKLSRDDARTPLIRSGRSALFQLPICHYRVATLSGSASSVALPSD